MLCGIDVTIGERGTQEKHAQKTAWYTANTWTQNTTDTLQKGLLPARALFLRQTWSPMEGAAGAICSRLGEGSKMLRRAPKNCGRPCCEMQKMSREINELVRSEDK